MRRHLAPPPMRPVERGAPPSFSVVIACYQAAPVIADAVESALEQTYPPLEVVVSDDGSTDDLDGALAPYAGRIVLLRGEHGGPAAARNAGFRVARGDYVVILDADDVFFAERLEAIADLLAMRPDLDIVTTNAVMEIDGRPVRDLYHERWTFEVDDQRRAILERNFVFGLAAVRRAALERTGGMDEGRPINPHAEDWDLWIRMLHAGAKAGLVDDLLARNRLGGTTLSADRRGRLDGRVAVLEKALATLDLHPTERRAAEGAVARQRLELRALEARAAVREGDARSRRRSAAVTLAPVRGRTSLVPRTRLRAAAWTLAPGHFGRRLRASATQGGWEGAAGVRHDREPGEISVAFYTDANQIGGAELSLENLLRALSPRVRAAVVGTDGRVVERLASARPGAVRVVVPMVRSMSDIASVATHRRAFSSLAPDIVQVNLNHPWACTWAQVAAMSIRGARVIAVEHLPRPPLHPSDLALKRLLERGLAAHVTVGRRSADELAALTGLKRARLVTIHNGVPDVEPEHVARRSGFVVGSLGRLHSQKGYDVLVDALARLDGVSAVLVGDGEERQLLEDRAAVAGVRDRLTIGGWVDDARRHLGSFDLFVLPSRFEAFPLTVLEAMLAGLPVVATDVGSVAEAVVGGSTGLLVPPGDVAALALAIERLRDDPGLRRRMGERGRRRTLDLFMADAMASRYEALYQELLA